ncbi:hypothetical protein K504DRAFT_395271 [Pleomassaria siparia CBS 279.74]|uniref:Large ribosomal subunit protein mL46 n=1 Tax=Pleomassaria siparia CBS 279.74 TaxID=1314801 RepID=A0A6G1KP61_9PLEO|nr:hypothetical protein K504DRAFT_395271 [Pleomassaria siparia CBS 279.74]
MSGQQTSRRLAVRASQYICRPCRDTISRNTYSTAATALQPDDQPLQHIYPVASATPRTSYVVNTGVVLSRPPQITRDLHPFESAYFLYQRRLNERLALPFTRYFYIKKNTPADIEWKRKLRQRLTPARDIGRYKGYGDEAWNDEALIGASESQVQWQVERLLDDAEKTGKEGEGEGQGEKKDGEEKEEGGEGEKKAVAPTTIGGKIIEHEAFERPMSRVTEADLKGDLKSLNRQLQRTLYLVVKDKSGQWMFPQDKMTKESLHVAAERIIVQSGGINMNTWVVGKVPIGHHQVDIPEESLKASPNPNELGYKTFFMKARIMAGQADLKENKLGLEDFKWLTREEIEKAVTFDYWRSVRNMLGDR